MFEMHDHAKLSSMTSTMASDLFEYHSYDQVCTETSLYGGKCLSTEDYRQTQLNAQVCFDSTAGSVRKGVTGRT